MYSNLIVVVCYWLNFLYIWRRDLQENLKGKGFVKLELKKGLKEVKEFQVVIKMCQMKRLFDHSLSLVYLGEKHVSPNKGVFCSGWEVESVFSDLFRCRS